uniref:Secreted protein n=1 Tax=Romanomermis culicivorax TaxID=13658 RepID=A0A915K9I0_ROMCU
MGRFGTAIPSPYLDATVSVLLLQCLSFGARQAPDELSFIIRIKRKGVCRIPSRISSINLQWSRNEMPQKRCNKNFSPTIPGDVCLANK